MIRHVFNLLPTVVRRFRHSYPSIEIHLTNRPSSEVMIALHEEEIDFCIITLPPDNHAPRGSSQQVALSNPKKHMRGKISLSGSKVELDTQHSFGERMFSSPLPIIPSHNRRRLQCSISRLSSAAVRTREQQSSSSRSAF